MVHPPDYTQIHKSGDNMVFLVCVTSKVFERIIYCLFYYKINFESPIWIPPEVLHPTVTSDFSNKNLKLSQ